MVLFVCVLIRLAVRCIWRLLLKDTSGSSVLVHRSSFETDAMGWDGVRICIIDRVGGFYLFCNDLLFRKGGPAPRTSSCGG